MSSTLQSQLAALHGAKSSTKRHEEAIGRGVNHSVNVGYSVSLSSNTSAKFKPSILYPDAKVSTTFEKANKMMGEKESILLYHKNCNCCLVPIHTTTHNTGCRRHIHCDYS